MGAVDKEYIEVMRQILQNECDEFVSSMSVPFGSFEKAKYELYQKTKKRCVYFFTTTIHSLQEVIEIMKDKSLFCNYDNAKFIIYRTQKGIREIIYQ